MLPKKNIILACHITGVFDVNRNQTLKDDDFGLVQQWAESLEKLEMNGVLFHNNFSDETIKKYQTNHLTFKNITYNDIYNPNVFRYFVYKNYLQYNIETIDSLFLTDVTDVTIIKNPFEEVHFLNHSLSIFCGDEAIPLDNEWMTNHSTHFRNQIPNYLSYENKFKNASLLNCGIIGGKVEVMLPFLNMLCDVHSLYNQHNKTAYTGDMGAFNYIIRSYYNSKVIHGFPVNTVFKDYQNDREDCWFRHK